MLRKIIITMFVLFANAGYSAPNIHSTTGIQRVIYITLDGVRWQDVYADNTFFPYIRALYAKELKFYGEPALATNTIEVASTPVSLPSYQSQMTGAVQACDNNSCGRVKARTFPEYLVKKLGFSKKDVVMFASWKTMSDAFQSEEGVAYENAGNTPVTDPITGLPDEVMQEFNFLQVHPNPAVSDRSDYHTISQSLHYLLKYKPKFMYISLAETDDRAHYNDLAGYQAKLRLYDDFLLQLFTSLTRLGIAENTTVIVTTDHGRGDGVHWTDHGPQYPESKQTWAFVWHGELEPVSIEGNVARYSTLSIRPTIEKIFNNAMR